MSQTKHAKRTPFAESAAKRGGWGILKCGNRAELAQREGSGFVHRRQRNPDDGRTDPGTVGQRKPPRKPRESCSVS